MSVILGMMARAPVAGHCKTRLAAALGDPIAAARLYAAMIQDSIDRYARVGATRNVVLAAPENEGVRVLADLVPPSWGVVAQAGEGLGDRLANAVRALEVDGSAVVLVDSDSPTLPIEPIAAALARFNGSGQVLLGPTADGGYYLIGLTSLELDVLRGIPWSTPEVMEATLARCAALSLTPQLLAPWYDVDDGRDLERLCQELSEHPDRAPRCSRILGELGLLRLRL